MGLPCALVLVRGYLSHVVYGPGFDASPMRAPSFQLWEDGSPVLALVLVSALELAAWCAPVRLFFQLLVRVLVRACALVRVPVRVLVLCLTLAINGHKYLSYPRNTRPLGQAGGAGSSKSDQDSRLSRWAAIFTAGLRPPGQVV